MSTEYNDRTIDVAISSNYEGKLELAFPNKIVAGLQKTVQMFIVELFSAIDSNIFNVRGGTVFGTELYNKNGVPNSDLMAHYISASISTVMEVLNKERSVYQDENLISAVVEELVTVDDVMTVKIAITTEAGSAYKFLVPITLSNFSS